VRVHLPREGKALQVARVFQVTRAGRDAPPKNLFDGAHERLFRGHGGRVWRATASAQRVLRRHALVDRRLEFGGPAEEVGFGTAHRPAELLQHRRVHVARGRQRRGRLGTRHRRARS